MFVRELGVTVTSGELLLRNNIRYSHLMLHCVKRKPKSAKFKVTVNFTNSRTESNIII